MALVNLNLTQLEIQRIFSQHSAFLLVCSLGVDDILLPQAPKGVRVRLFLRSLTTLAITYTVERPLSRDIL